jgi:hypothetical protein
MLKKYLSKKISSSYIFQFCSGFLSIIPIFINIESFKLVLIPFNPSIYTSSAGGAPVNIGFIAITFTIFYSILRNYDYNLFKSLKYYIIFGLFYLFYNVLFLGLFRGLSLSIFYIYTIAIYYILIREIDISGFKHGFLTGIFIISASRLLHHGFHGYFDGWHTLARNFFGIELYQYWISYPAVMSLIIMLLPIVFLRGIKDFKSGILILIILVSCTNELFMASKRAPLVDIALINITVIILVSLLYYYKKEITSSSLLIILFSFILIIGLIHLNRYTPLLDKKSYEHRALTYEMAIEKINNNSNKVEVSNSSGSNEVLVSKNVVNFIRNIFNINTMKWGGYSNLFLQYYINLGLIGLIFYLLSLLLSFYLIFKIIFKGCKFNIREKKFEYKFLVFSSLLISYIVGNTLNMNQQLPFYLSGFFILLLYSR